MELIQAPFAWIGLALYAGLMLSGTKRSSEHLTANGNTFHLATDIVSIFGMAFLSVWPSVLASVAILTVMLTNLRGIALVEGSVYHKLMAKNMAIYNASCVVAFAVAVSINVVFWLAIRALNEWRYTL